jgi:hypothetical protein
VFDETLSKRARSSETEGKEIMPGACPGRFKYIHESLMATLHKQRRWFNKLDRVSGELGSSESEEERSVLGRLHSMSLACKVMVLIWIEAGTDLGSVFVVRERD